MDRISTSAQYQSALTHILAAQSRQTEAQGQVSSGLVSTNLRGYGENADTLTATRSVKSRVDSYINNAKSLSSTLDVQDQALGQLSGAAQSARGAVAEALATGSADGLMTSLQGYLSQASDALNTEYQGRRLFAGGQTDTNPVQQVSLADLTAAPSISSLFSNDQLPTSSRLDDTVTVQTGFLANNLGEPLFQALQAIQAINEGPLGPLSGSLTQAQQTALQQALPSFDGAWSNLNEAVAQNGGVQNRVAAVQTALTDRQNAITGLLSGITDVDMADAVSKLQLSQTAMQASAQAFSTLQGSSLLNILAPGA